MTIAQVLIPIVTLLAGVWITTYLRRPRLQVVGSGGGGSGGEEGHYLVTLRIGNPPGLLGIRLGKTIVLGKRLHGYIQKGLVLERGPVRHCTAHIYKRKKRFRRRDSDAKLLWWRSPESPTEPAQRVTFQSGDEFDLFVLARFNSEPDKYTFFEPNGTSLNPKRPPAHAMLNEPREYEIVFQDNYGRSKLKVAVAVRKGLDGRLTWVAGGTSSSF